MRSLFRRSRETWWVAGSLALVLVPALLLGWLSLRAVQNERAASRERILQDNARYARFAARILRQELETLTESWSVLVPRGVGWEERRREMQQAVHRAQGHTFIAQAYLLHVSGAELYPTPADPDAPLAVPERREALRFQESMAAGENAEFDTGDLEAARRIYNDLLQQLHVPQLRAIVLAHLGRVALSRRDFQGALSIHDRILDEYPREWDLENRPLALHAMLQRAHALEELERRQDAATQLVEAYAWLLRESGAMGDLQFALTRENIETRLQALLPTPLPADWSTLVQRIETLRQQERQEPQADFFAQKLSRKLARAWLEGMPYATPMRFVSDATDAVPFLLAYMFLPDSRGTGVTGLVGFQVDLQALAQERFPTLLAQVQLAENLHLAVVDATGQNVLTGSPAPDTQTLAQETLADPFGFWSINVRSLTPGAAEQAIDFRTTVLLYGVLLLLLTIIAGSVLVMMRWRREKQLSQQKTTFVSSVSHELRTPLTSIRMFAEMLEANESDTNPQRRRYLQTIRRECDRLQRLIESVLDFTALEQGTRRLQLEYEEVGALVRAIAEDFRDQAEQAGFRYTVDVGDDLPEVRLDADAVRQILLNLLSNAMKYSDDRREITVRAFHTPREVALQVRDRGIGIAPEEQSRIFEDFYRVDTRVTSSRSGLGLGLTLVRGLAEAHGGRVSIESALHEGACFTVWLPRHPEGEVRGPNDPERLAAEA